MISNSVSYPNRGVQVSNRFCSSSCSTAIPFSNLLRILVMITASGRLTYMVPWGFKLLHRRSRIRAFTYKCGRGCGNSPRFPDTIRVKAGARRGRARSVMYEVKSSESVACASAPTKQNLRCINGGLKREAFDADYVQRLVEGDPATERHFFAYFSQLLWIKLRSRLRDSQLIEDVRQETLFRVITALKSKHSLHSPEKLGA